MRAGLIERDLKQRVSREELHLRFPPEPEGWLQSRTAERVQEVQQSLALKATKHRVTLRDGRLLQYHRPNDSEAPLCVQDFFSIPSAALLEVEIGPGKGEFLQRRATEHPNRCFLGIDKRPDRVELTTKKMNNLTRASGLEDCKLEETSGQNWKIVLADARRFLGSDIPPIEVLHVYQPDPWPKTKHHKNRFFRSPDARAWAEALREGGELRISTDHREYFEEILDLVDAWGFMQLQIAFEKKLQHGAGLTHFENIFLNKGQSIFKVFYVRKRTATTTK